MKAGAKIAAGSTLLLVLGFGGLNGYRQLVRAGVLRYNKYDRRERGDLRVGDTAPDLALNRYDGTPLRLSELWASKPVFVVFGSCT